MPDTPGDRIAVIIPVFNVASFLEEAIRSALTQDYPHKEVIVVDDGSASEHAAEIARICECCEGVTLLRQPHIGAAAARDFGRSRTTAPLIFFFDGDDLLLPGALAFFADAMHRNPTAVASYARSVAIDESGHITDTPRPGIDRLVSGIEVLHTLLCGRQPFLNGSICARRPSLEKLAANNHRLKLGEDWVLWCHLALSGDIIPAGDRIVLHRRVHQDNVTNILVYDDSEYFASYDSVVNDLLFIEAVGKESLKSFREKSVCNRSAYLATRYARRNQPVEALRYLRQITLPISAFY